MSAEPRHLDGNAIGGDLAAIFGQEVTAAVERCGGCGSVRELGALIVYLAGPGDVLRCPDCGVVLMVCVRIAGRYRLAPRGMAWLDLPAGD